MRSSRQHQTAWNGSMHSPLSKRGVAFGSLICLVSLGVARAQGPTSISAKTSVPTTPVVGQLVSQQVAIPASASIPTAASAATPPSATAPVASAAPVVPGFAPPQGPVIIYMPAGWEPWPGAYAANQRAPGMPAPAVAPPSMAPMPQMPQMAPRVPMQNPMRVAPPRATAMQRDPYFSWMQQPQPAPARPAATQPGTFQPLFGNLGSPGKRSAPVAPPKSSVVGVFGMPTKAASQPAYVPPMSMYAPMNAQTMSPQPSQAKMHAQGVPTPAVVQQPHLAQSSVTAAQPSFAVEEEGLADTGSTPANEPPRSSRRQKYKPAPAAIASTPARTPAQAVSHPTPSVEETLPTTAKCSPAGPAKISSVVATVERPAPLKHPVPTKQPEQTQSQATASKFPAPQVAAPAKPQSSPTIVSAPRPIQPTAPRRSARTPLAEEAIGAVDRVARRIIDPIIEPNLAEQTPVCPPIHSAPATKPTRSTESPMPSPLQKPPVSLVATRPLEHARPLKPIHVAPEEKQIETVEADKVAASEEEVSTDSQDAEVCTAAEQPAVIEESDEADEQLAAKELPVEGDDAAADLAVEDIPVEEVPTECTTEKAESSKQERREAVPTKKAANEESWPELEPKSEAERAVEHAPAKGEAVAQAEEPQMAKPTPMPVAAVQPSEPQDKPVLVTDRAPAPHAVVKPKLRRDAVEASHLTAPVRSNPLRVSANPSQASNPLR